MSVHVHPVIQPTCRNRLCLPAGKKSTSSPTFFKRYLKDIQNFLFWVPWTCLAMHTHFYVYLQTKSKLPARPAITTCLCFSFLHKLKPPKHGFLWSMQSSFIEVAWDVVLHVILIKLLCFLWSGICDFMNLHCWHQP